MHTFPLRAKGGRYFPASHLHSPPLHLELWKSLLFLNHNSRSGRWRFIAAYGTEWYRTVCFEQLARVTGRENRKHLNQLNSGELSSFQHSFSHHGHHSTSQAIDFFNQWCYDLVPWPWNLHRYQGTHRASNSWVETSVCCVRKRTRRNQKLVPRGGVVTSFPAHAIFPTTC